MAHRSAGVHKDNITAAMKQCSFQPIVVEGASFHERVAKAEFTTSVFASNHNIGIRFVNDLVPYVQKLAIDPGATRHMKLKEDKCKQIIKNVFYKQAFGKLFKILNAILFSVLVYESTDIDNKKVLCISVQYANVASGKIMQRLLQLLELDATRGTASDLFASFKKFFDENQINMKNIVALACDNTSVMVGKFKGFHVYLKEIVPHLILLNCICHTSAIIAKSSCTAIPKEVEELIKSAYNYFSNSPKCSEELADIKLMF